MFHRGNYHNLKSFYRECVSKRLNDAFPTLISYNHFIELQKSILIFLCYLLQTLAEEETGIYFIDPATLKTSHIEHEKK